VKLTPLLGVLCLASALASTTGVAQTTPAATGSLRITVAARTAAQFVSPAGAERPGFDIELLQRFAGWYRTKTGSQVRFDIVYLPTLPAVLESVRRGTDMGVGDITATTERARLVDFSAPILPVRSVVVALPGVFQSSNWRTKIKGRRLAGLQGGTSLAEASRLRAVIGDIEVVSVATEEMILDALLARPPRIDAAVFDLPWYWTTGKQHGLVLVDNVGEPQDLAIVLHKGSPLKKLVDAFLATFTHSMGYFRLIDSYFGHEAAQMVRMSRGQP
jgi:ABC-type amino acid transport substrate-binding protein